jgi:hypothetical protein
MAGGVRDVSGVILGIKRKDINPDGDIIIGREQWMSFIQLRPPGEPNTKKPQTKTKTAFAELQSNFDRYSWLCL